jgi:hypothetical protein
MMSQKKRRRREEERKRKKGKQNKMENETETLINTQLEKLPEELRRAIKVVPWKSTIREIAVSNKVSLDKIPLVEEETMLIIYGFENPINYVSNLVSQAGLEESQSLAIATSANDEIFMKITEVVDQPKSALEPSQVNKKEIIENLAQRVMSARQEGSSVAPKMPEQLIEIHPMVEAGEKVHDVPPLSVEEKAKIAPAPETIIEKPTQEAKSMSETPFKSAPVEKPVHYPGGKDPYREPLE